MRQTKSACTADGEVGRVIEGVVLERVVGPEMLDEAWRRVRRNKGGSGGDGVTIATFAEDLDPRLAALRSAVLTETYRPGKVRRTWMRKPDGRKRKLTVPSVVDRILQTAVMLTVSKAIDGKFSGRSWAYREGRGVANALADLRQAREDGFIWTLDADIARYFDRVSHQRLLDDVMIWIDDLRIIRLLQLWLRSFSLWGRGIAQGSPISPLLANIFLHPMDRLLELEGFRAVRYADDFVALCRTEPQTTCAMKIVTSHLAARGLRLNIGKSSIVPPGDPFVFLGEEIAAVSVEGRS